MMNRIVLVGSLAVLATVFSLAPASAADLVSTDDGLALQGYDPVSFFAEDGPAEGNADITEAHRGATYRFASAQNHEAFQADPDRYAPAFGGYCAYGVGLGKLFVVEIETWQIIDERLVLNKDMKVRRLFDKDRAGNFAKANAEWPALQEKAAQ